VSLLRSVYDIPGKVARVAVAVNLHEWFVGEWHRCITPCHYHKGEGEIKQDMTQIVQVV